MLVQAVLRIRRESNSKKQPFWFKDVWFVHVCNLFAFLLWVFKMLLSFVRLIRSLVNSNSWSPQTGGKMDVEVNVMYGHVRTNRQDPV